MDIETKIYEMLFEETTHEELMRACTLMTLEGETLQAAMPTPYRGPRAIRLEAETARRSSFGELAVLGRRPMFVTEVPPEVEEAAVDALVNRCYLVGAAQRVRFADLRPGAVVDTY